MLLGAMNWMQVEAYLEKDDRIVIVIGSCEQHGYLSVQADVCVPMAVAEAACAREDVLIAPPLSYGISPYFAAYPGTISLRPETFARVVREVLDALVRQGFRRVLVSNGHGGNTGVLGPVLTETNTANPEAKIALFEWWRHPAVTAVAKAAGLLQYHANWSENFPDLTRITPVPRNEKLPVRLPPGTSASDARELLGDGSFGGAYQVDDIVTARFFNAAVDAMVVALQDL